MSYAGLPDGYAVQNPPPMDAGYAGLPEGFSVQTTVPQQQAPQMLPRWDIPGDIGRAFNQAKGALATDYQNAAAPITKGSDIPSRGLALGKSALDAIAMGMSPITGGIVHGLGGNIIASAIDNNSNDPDVKLALSKFGNDPKALGDALSNLTAMASPFSGGEDAAIAAAPQAPDNLRRGAQEAHDAGFVLPPRMAVKGQTAPQSLLSGFGGKVAMNFAASEKNQDLVNALAGKTLGLEEGEPITQDAIDAAKGAMAPIRQEIVNSIPLIKPDSDFSDALDAINDRTSSLAKTFPNITKNEPVETLVDDLRQPKEFSTADGMEMARQLRANATANFKGAPDANRLALALAQRDSANAIEDLIARNLSDNADDYASNALLPMYDDARTQAAKAYDIESAANPVTGNVNPQRIAALMGKRPLSGDLLTIAKAAKAFPGAFQPIDRFGGSEPLSTLDLLTAGYGAATGHPLYAAAVLGKPLARATALSPMAQNAIFAQQAATSAPNYPIYGVGAVQPLINALQNRQGNQQ